MFPFLRSDSSTLMEYADTAFAAHELRESIAKMRKMFSSKCFACGEKSTGELIEIAYHPKYLKLHPDNYIERGFCTLDCFISKMRYRHYYLVQKEEKTNALIKMILKSRK